MIWINGKHLRWPIQEYLLECINFGVRRWLKRKTTHQHLFLPKDYSGSPATSIYTEWSKEEAEAYLTSGWGEGTITEFNLDYLYGPEPEVSGE